MNDNTHQHLYCVIMCGGIGTRFWPRSRRQRPKQFIDILGTGRSLLQMTYDRLLPLVDPSHVILVTNAQYVPLINEQLPQVPAANILAEPARRNTAPCIAWAANHIKALDPQAIMLVTPSDHLITRQVAFLEALERGIEFVEDNDALLTIGIKPTRPETGYGYIQIGREVEPGIRAVKTFTEKPDRELAQVFIETGEFFWNSGIFLWKATDILAALALHNPDMAALFDAGAHCYGTPGEADFISRTFPACMGISIDYAVMEKARNVYVHCADPGWSDLGTWTSLYEESPRNSDANVTQGCRVLAYNSRGNIFTAGSERLVVVDSLQDYIVADDGDVLLICPRANEQRMRLMVGDVKEKYGDRFL